MTSESQRLCDARDYAIRVLLAHERARMADDLPPVETACAGCEAVNEWLTVNGFVENPQSRPRDPVAVLEDLRQQLDRRNRQLFARRQDRANYRDEIRSLQRSRDRWRRRAEANWSDAQVGRDLHDEHVRDTIEMGALAEYFCEEMHAEPPDGKGEGVCQSAIRILRGLVAELEAHHRREWTEGHEGIPAHEPGERPDDCGACRALRGK